jgi:hypothetical protein
MWDPLPQQGDPIPYQLCMGHWRVQFPWSIHCVPGTVLSVADKTAFHHPHNLAGPPAHHQVVRGLSQVKAKPSP